MNSITSLLPIHHALEKLLAQDVESAGFERNPVRTPSTSSPSLPSPEQLLALHEHMQNLRKACEDRNEEVLPGKKWEHDEAWEAELGILQAIKILHPHLV